MLQEKLDQPYRISFEVVHANEMKAHKHSFFEMVVVRSGHGIQSLNQSKCSYRPGNLFLLAPDDEHFFEAETPTGFFYLRFNNIYIQGNEFGLGNLRSMEYILQNVNRQAGCILRNVPDQGLVGPIVEAIYNEYKIKDLYNEEMISQLVNTLIVVAARNVARFMPDQISGNIEQKALNILQYIQHHIYEPEKLKVENMSNLFALSGTYLGTYFKRKMGETLQDYIINYKLKLIAHRLKFSDKRLKEIADEFGFTDVSHLNKYFKKQKGINLKAYKALINSGTSGY